MDVDLRASRDRRLAVLRLAALFALGAQIVASARAKTPAPTQSNVATQDGTTQLPNIVVTATRSGQRDLDVPAAISSVAINNIDQHKLGVNLSEVLDAVPGVVVRSRQNYAQDEQVSIRGFGARSTFGVRGVRLYTDGIPATMPDGSGQISHFNLDSAERVEVLRGPFSALYGNSSGGVIQVFTADGSDTPELRSGLVGGSDGVLRASANLRGRNDSFGYNVDLTDFRTDGYRDHSAARRRSANAKFSWQLDDATQLTVLANNVDIPWAQDPLGLSYTQFRENPRKATSVATQFDTRKDVGQSQVGSVIEHAINEQQRLQVSAYAGQRAVVQFLAIPPGAQNNPLHAGGVIDLDGDYRGVDARWTYASGPLELTAGLNTEGQYQQRRGYENFVGTALGVRGNLRRDERNTVNNFDQYAQANWTFNDDWSLLAGVRHSDVRFRNSDRYITARNPDDSGRRDYSATSPVLGLLYHPSTESTVYASWGKGFETPTFSELGYRRDGGAGLNFDLEAAPSNNVELGYRLRASDAFNVDVALFRADTDNEIAVATNSGGRSTFRNVGSTRREGVEASFDVPLAPRWKLSAAATLLDAEFRTPFLACSGTPCNNPTAPVRAGSRIPGVPELALHAALAWGDNSGWRLGLAADHLGNIAVNDVNSEYAPAYTTFSADIGYGSNLKSGSLRTFLRIDNLTDHRYVGSIIVNDGNGRYYEPAAGRTLLLGAQWLWQRPR
ncbi:MAG: TonB-dependent receptor [Dokdonella sp.]